MIGIIGYGLGNIGSLRNMFRRIGQEAQLVTEPDRLHEVDRLVLPGVGAFDAGARRLALSGFSDAIQDFAKSGRPIFGICLGMQLLLDASDEGTGAGLGLIPGKSVRFESRQEMRVPHMGWSQLVESKPSPLFADLPQDHRFYFVHSYKVVLENQIDELASSNYGGPFTSMVERENVIGAQFHPEKSHAFGMALLDKWSRS
jgi:glutamine amidotransferase